MGDSQHMMAFSQNGSHLANGLANPNYFQNGTQMDHYNNLQRMHSLSHMHQGHGGQALHAPDGST